VQRNPEVSYVSNLDFSYCEENPLMVIANEAHYMVVCAASLQYIIMYHHIQSHMQHKRVGLENWWTGGRDSSDPQYWEAWMTFPL